MASINSLASDHNRSPTYYEPSFRVVLEDHMTYFRLHPNTQTLTIDPHLALMYEFDLDGLLISQNVPHHLHWLIGRMNRLNSSSEYRRDMLALLIPSIDDVDRIRQIHSTQRILEVT